MSDFLDLFYVEGGADPEINNNLPPMIKGVGVDSASPQNIVTTTTLPSTQTAQNNQTNIMSWVLIIVVVLGFIVLLKVIYTLFFSNDESSKPQTITKVEVVKVVPQVVPTQQTIVYQEKNNNMQNINKNINEIQSGSTVVGSTQIKIVGDISVDKKLPAPTKAIKQKPESTMRPMPTMPAMPKMPTMPTMQVRQKEPEPENSITMAPNAPTFHP